MLKTITEKDKVAFVIKGNKLITVTLSGRSCLGSSYEHVSLSIEAKKVLTKNNYTLDEMMALGLWYVDSDNNVVRVVSEEPCSVVKKIKEDGYENLIVTLEEIKHLFVEKEVKCLEQDLVGVEPGKFLLTTQQKTFDRFLDWKDADSGLVISRRFFVGNEILPDGMYDIEQIRNIISWQVIDDVAYPFLDECGERCERCNLRYYVKDKSSGLYPEGLVYTGSMKLE